MSVKITATVKCSECKKEITKPAKIKIGGRPGRRELLFLPNVYRIDVWDSELRTQRGYNFHPGDVEEDYLLCSPKCVLSVTRRLLPKLLVDKED